MRLIFFHIITRIFYTSVHKIWLRHINLKGTLEITECAIVTYRGICYRFASRFFFLSISQNLFRWRTRRCSRNRYSFVNLKINPNVGISGEIRGQATSKSRGSPRLPYLSLSDIRLSWTLGTSVTRIAMGNDGVPR